MPDTCLPKYVLDALALMQGKAKPGTVHIAVVDHEDRCEVFEGKRCNCEPVTTIEPVKA